MSQTIEASTVGNHFAQTYTDVDAALEALDHLRAVGMRDLTLTTVPALDRDGSGITRWYVEAKPVDHEPLRAAKAAIDHAYRGGSSLVGASS